MDSGNIFELPNHKINSVMPWAGESAPRKRKRLIRPTVIVVGALLLITLLTIGTYIANAPAALPVTGSFFTDKGEHRCQKLPDASEACLNTDSSVQFIFAGVRHLELESGEIAIMAGADPRPLEVQSGSLLVRNLLNAHFDVYRRRGSTVVTVIDGSVELLSRANHVRSESDSSWKTARVLHHLQQVELADSGDIFLKDLRLTEPALSRLMAWQLGQIDLTDMSLSDALQEFSRYQPIDRFNFQHQGMRLLHVGGLMQTTHLQDFLDSLVSVYGIEHHLGRGPDGRATIYLTRRRVASEQAPENRQSK